MPVDNVRSDEEGHTQRPQPSFQQTMIFARLCALLKNDIILTQPIEVPTTSAPDVLPDAIVDFLMGSVGLAEETVNERWAKLKDDIWAMEAIDASEEEENAFRLHGWKRGLTSLSLYPPTHCCTNPNCLRQRPLKKEESRQVVVYTMGKGVRPAWSIHLYCPDCRTNYHHNYSVNAGTRTYYSSDHKYIQVGEHQFVEDKMINAWIAMMLVGWFSATNCARMYDMALSQRDTTHLEQAGWQFGMSLTTEHVWDSFVVLTLLKDHVKCNIQLQVPHTGAQKDRFTALMEARNEHIIHFGQDEVGHYCDKCMRVFVGPDGKSRRCQIIVCDGVTLGHCCCGIFRCTISLGSNRHRFCPHHDSHHKICAITGCNEPVLKGSKACMLSEHQEMERLHFEKGTAAFILKERLQRQRVAHPNNSMADRSPAPDEESDDVEENIEFFELEDGQVRIRNARNPGSVGVIDDEDGEDGEDIEEPCEAVKSPKGNRKVKALFGRRRTHNEQTLVRPCGVIHARATFFGAEAVSNVLVFLKNAFSVPGAQKPDHFIYDTNCDAKQQADARGDPWFKGIGMCVDVWHFLNKHKITHAFCQQNCNPADYPELMGSDGKWFFNTSVAEQINVWLGGYHAICREMLPVKYNFFLNEMICLRNEIIVAKLAADGHHPGYAPRTTL